MHRREIADRGIAYTGEKWRVVGAETPTARKNGIQVIETTTRLFLSFLDLGAGPRHFAFSHIPSQSADVILEEFVFAFQLIMV